ncbi:MAG: BMP family ABC transporter substrate-binding protein [Schaedlerella sp.]|nr:BMP family ABC transporter substrate-binding protein [Schaedlerella sp.]
MSLQDYEKAYKSGRKAYQAKMMHGENPTLEVLDSILPSKGEYSEFPLGLIQIPTEQIVGTKTFGRSTAFASNFMPVLDVETEFAAKWINLSISHEEEGIREPVKVYEYMNKFYVLEGNKRVSVLKYYDAATVSAIVTRLIPKRTEEKENKIYYEFLDFYEGSKINYIWFSEVGNFSKMLEIVKRKPGEVWTDEERGMFSSNYSRFLKEYKANGGDKLSITPGDAFLAFINIYGYEDLDDLTTTELKNLVTKSWEEFQLLGKEDVIELKMNPNSEKKNFFSALLPKSTPKQKIAFIYEKTPETSAWIYAHELGRLHLEETFSEEVSTIYRENVTLENIDDILEEVVTEGCNLIFTTSPSFAQASVKAAIAHPQIKVLNCSLNTTHRYIRTYYARMHEAKFLLGAIAGIFAENNKILYTEDYPIYGSIANINAFALGAKMTNPSAKIYLEWTSAKDWNLEETIKKIQPSCISGKDMLIPKDRSRYFGLYHMDGDTPHKLAMPLWHWGKFYEQLIHTIMEGTWKYDDSQTSEKKAINYWWGISAGVVDVVCSKNLPSATKRLIDLLKHSISLGQCNVFYGILHSQDGIIQDDPEKELKPEEISKMDWLEENVIGSIPKKADLKEQAESVILQQGVRQAKE